MLVPIILCGGCGNRLWPLSREAYPKQLLKLTNHHSLFQNTLKNINKICIAKPIVVTNEAYRFLIKEQLNEINALPQSILLERVAKDTALAIALSCLYVKEALKEKLVLILPSDHCLSDLTPLEHVIKIAEVYANQGNIVTFGIKPHDPNTAYGYIKAGEVISADCYQAEQFTEKPDFETASKYLQEGVYFWNSGIFLAKAEVLLEELKKYAATIYEGAIEIYKKNHQDSFGFVRFDSPIVEDLPKLSIDYAVMEKTQKAVVCPLNLDWIDIGSWKALWELSNKDINGNAIKGDVLIDEVENCYIDSHDKLIAAVGVKDLIVVDTPDAVLICDQDHSQKVKNIVEQLKKDQRPEVEFPHRVYRPWGYFESLITTPFYQVKRLMIKPQATLSLQLHHKRAEHWIIVRGVATVIRGEEELMLCENESTYIPIGCKHRISNLGQELLYIIEIQTGSYFGEDDIVRLEDVYERSKRE